MASFRLTLPPRFLELAYTATLAVLSPFQRWLRPGSAVEHAFLPVEELTKSVLFGCVMCGQCVLHSTGMTCPMTCPKNLRNGPCGGVRLDGRCEVRPDMMCVWAQAWERSKSMPAHGAEFLHILPPLDRRLEGSSAWINYFQGVTGEPSGWRA